nr:carbonic anhydrase 2-like isoform X1 [Ciona intestinalis]|eukprot:XP_002121620.1 carbonic anhydrase 2-like isoform X1 [Ciona intestinalis]
MIRTAISKGLSLSRACISASNVRQFNDQQRRMAHWGYAQTILGPEKWYLDYLIGKEGKRQSPIDIKERDLDPKNFPSLDMCYDPSEITKVKNTGTSVKFFSTGTKSGFTGGPFQHRQRLVQFHFHWGAENNRGSEHTINGRPTSAELHFVHYNDKYPDATEAMKHPDGLSVLGVFIDVEDTCNPAYQVLLHNVRKVRYAHTEAHVEGCLDVDGLFPSDKGAFAHYHGSLTTPPLTECVEWINFREITGISQEQMDTFRGLYSTEEGKPAVPLVDNFRPVQPIHGRTVYCRDCM